MACYHGCQHQSVQPESGAHTGGGAALVSTGDACVMPSRVAMWSGTKCDCTEASDGRRVALSVPASSCQHWVGCREQLSGAYWCLLVLAGACWCWVGAKERSDAIIQPGMVLGTKPWHCTVSRRRCSPRPASLRLAQPYIPHPGAAASQGPRCCCCRCPCRSERRFPCCLNRVGQVIQPPGLSGAYWCWVGAKERSDAIIQPGMVLGTKPWHCTISPGWPGHPCLCPAHSMGPQHGRAAMTGSKG